MWILIWSLWFNKNEAMTRFEGNTPFKTEKDCKTMGDFKSASKNFKITYQCKYFTPTQFDKLKKDIQDRSKWD